MLPTKLSNVNTYLIQNEWVSFNGFYSVCWVPTFFSPPMYPASFLPQALTIETTSIVQFSYLYYKAGRRNDYCIIFQFQLSLLRDFSEFYFFICKRRRLTWISWSWTLLQDMLLPPLAPSTSSGLCQPYSCLKPLSFPPQFISYFPSSPSYVSPFSPVQVVFSSFCNYEFTCMISLMFCEELLITLYILAGPIFFQKSIVKEKQREQQLSEGEAEVLQVQWQPQPASLGDLELEWLVRVVPG